MFTESGEIPRSTGTFASIAAACRACFCRGAAPGAAVRPVQIGQILIAHLGQRQIKRDPPLPEADHPFRQQWQEGRVMHDGDQRCLSRRLDQQMADLGGG